MTFFPILMNHMVVSIMYPQGGIIEVLPGVNPIVALIAFFGFVFGANYLSKYIAKTVLKKHVDSGLLIIFTTISTGFGLIFSFLLFKNEIILNYWVLIGIFSILGGLFGIFVLPKKDKKDEME